MQNDKSKFKDKKIFREEGYQIFNFEILIFNFI